jgi:hypothetical protein
MTPRILGYSYDATVVCPCCARHDFDEGRIGDAYYRPEIAADGHGLPQHMQDRNGDTVRPVFSTDEFAAGETCGVCFERLE